MGNVVRILLRDLKRLIKAPAALIVVGALLVLPSIYTWYNVVAFWNPYEATGNLSVAVVNQDAGTETDVTGKLNVGDKIVEELAANEQLDWIMSEYDQAMADLEVGDVYAVYVIPEDFSECIVSPLAGEAKSPHIQYFANEKLGPVSPKITDAAANALDQKINSAFVETVSDAATKAVDEALDKAEAKIASSEAKASSKIGEAKAALAEVRETLSGMQGTIDEARAKVAGVNEAASGARSTATDAQAVLADVVSVAESLQSSLSDLTSGASSAKLADALAELSKLTAKVSSIAEDLASAAASGEADVGMATARMQPVVDALREASSDLQEIADDLSAGSTLAQSFSEAAQDASDRADNLQAQLDKVTDVAEEITAAAQEMANTSESMSGAVETATSALSEYSENLYGSAASTVSSSVSQVANACARLSAAVSSLDSAVASAIPVLGQLDGILADSGTSVGQTDALIGDVQADLNSALSDARMLAQSGVIADLIGDGTLNTRNISEFMSAPTTLSTTRFYHPNAYGTAMAPLFMNLSFWIGAFMLVIIFLLEVDSEGIEDLKPYQRYLGRFILFAILAVLQAVICCAGTLALGVEAANVPALFVASAASSLAFLSVIYALSSTFKHVGKALCIILVFAQIPGGSGLYPLELTSSFFQSIYPFLPFTYGINALREAIGGFYDGYFVNDMVMLAVFFAGSLAFGLLFVPLISNVVRMTARQVREGDLYNGEDAKAPARPYRTTQVLRALAEKESYREELEKRYARFSRRYPAFIYGAIAFGLGGPVVLAVLGALDAAEKVTLLTALVLGLFGLIVFVVVVESMRFSFERQLNLGQMSEESLLRIFSSRNRLVQLGARRSRRGEPDAEDGEEGPADGEADSHRGHHARRKAWPGSNVALIMRRDFGGLFRNVMSTVITVGLVVLPSLFAWYNILACWDVFENTGNLSVAVASQDQGYTSDLVPIEINVGDKVLSALRENDQINWVFTDAEDAIEGTKAGEYYAALVIPEAFSAEMLTFYEGDSASAPIDYYVNEKKNAIAPNITNTGADTVSAQVNSTFADTVSEMAVALAQSLSNTAEESDIGSRVADLAEHMNLVASRLDQSANLLGSYSSLAKDSQGLVQGSAEVVSSARSAAQAAASDIGDEKQRLRELAAKLPQSIEGLEGKLDNAKKAVDGLKSGADTLASGAMKNADDLAKQLKDKSDDINARAAEIDSVLEDLQSLRDALNSGITRRMSAQVSDGELELTTSDDGSDPEAIDDAADDAQASGAQDDGDTPADEQAGEDGEGDGGSDVAGAALETEADATEGDSESDAADDGAEGDAADGGGEDAPSTGVEAELSVEAQVMAEDTLLLDKDIAVLSRASEILHKASDSCAEAADALEAGSAEAESKVDELEADAKAAKKAVEKAVKAFKESLEPKVSKLKTDISSLVGDLDRGAESLSAFGSELPEAMDSVAAALGGASEKVAASRAKLQMSAQEVRKLATAVDEALATGNTETLRSLLQGNAGDLAAALSAPVQIERIALYPSENFGSAMAPLYCTLAIFIGSLLIMVAMQPEVSRRGREQLIDPKPRQLYFGRFGAVAAISLMQTTLLSLGCLFFLKVQVAHPLLFMVAFWIAGLVFAFIIYTLVVAFGNLGKAIAVLLLIVQVTACGGSYPLQILPDFVQAISPWVPATYIVNALRAAMMGVYQNDFWISMGHLALFIIPFLLLGLVLRKPLERFMKFYVSKVEECKIME